MSKLNIRKAIGNATQLESERTLVWPNPCVVQKAMTSILHEAIIAWTVLVTKNDNCPNIHYMKLEHKSPATKSQ